MDPPTHWSRFQDACASKKPAKESGRKSASLSPLQQAAAQGLKGLQKFYTPDGRAVHPDYLKLTNFWSK